MKKIIFRVFIFTSITICSSCSSDKATNPVVDSFNTTAVIEKKTIQTDSGRIEIEIIKGNAEGKAVLINAEGKIIGRGLFSGDQPVGAWKTYDENGNIISAQHFSKGKPLQNLDITDFEFKQVENKKLGAKFKVPKNWTENTSPNEALIVSFAKTENVTSLHIKPNVIIVKAKLQKGEDVNTLAKMQLELMHENFNHVQVVQENNIVVDSCFSFQRYGMYDTGTDQAGFLNVIVVAGNDVWIISCEAQNNSQGEFLKYQGVFQDIVESFQRMN